MKAHQITEYGPAEVIKLVELPDPQPKANWVLIQVKAFGLNRSELMTRQGHSGDGVTVPRVLGIECVGIVVDGGGTDLKPGQKVAAAMGFMGRKFDGGYAEMALLPRTNVFAIETSLPWGILGALPESYLTAWGVLKEAIELKPGSNLLIRGGTSSVGLAAASIAKDMGCRVLATTRNKDKIPAMEAAGVDHVILDDGDIAEKVKAVCSNGVDGVVELVGLKNTILDCLQACAPKGTVGMVGFLGYSWDYNFFPWMPSTVKLTLYSSESLHTDHATPVLQTIVDKVGSGAYNPNIHQVFEFEDVVAAHKIMESSRAAGKLVVKV